MFQFCALYSFKRNLIDLMAVEIQKLCVLFYYQQSPSLEAGYPLVYWPWYRTATAQDVRGSLPVFGSKTLNGYTPQEMCVSPHFSSLKEETLEKALLTPQIFELFVMKKAAEYMKTRKVKTISCRLFTGADRNDPLHYGIKKGSPLCANHLHALILWCDFIKFRVKLIESLSGDDLKHVKSENSKFFWVSRSLRELVAYFGSDRYGSDMNGEVQGPFYCASREVQNLSGFCIEFNIPTATTKILPVALRMAGPHGMLMTVRNKSEWGSSQPLFDTTWISTFFEEEEQLWFGSVYGLRMEEVFIMDTARVYWIIIRVLYDFDATLSGGDNNFDSLSLGVTPDEIKKLDFCLKYVRNENMENEDKPDAVDDYVLDSVKAFCAQKRKLSIDAKYVHNGLDESMQNMIFYGLSESKSIPSDRTNIIRSELFVQFPNLVEIEMETKGYPLNPLSLLSVLDEANIPDCFQVLALREYVDYRRGMADAFNAIPDITEQFNAKNWDISMESSHQWGISEWTQEETIFFIKRIIITRI